MHAKSIVTRVVSPCLQTLHTKRANAFLRATTALLVGGVGSLTAIAQHLQGGTTLKHRIKSVDRLLGNVSVHAARIFLYQALARQWIGSATQLLVAVDWSDLTRDQHFQLLRASVVVQGRSVTLYEEVHPQKKLGNRLVHRHFVQRLAQIVPPECKLIIMTDAGFHAPWFQLVLEQGWDFIGRLRGRNQVCLADEGVWKPVRDWFRFAKGNVCQDLGEAAYSRSNPVSMRAILGKRPTTRRHALNLYGKKRTGRRSARHGRSACEPWLLASSLGLQCLSGQVIVALYGQRMRIEQSFRDTKNTRLGVGLECARSRSILRLEMLLLLIHFATFVQRLIGESAKQQQLECHFTATGHTGRHEISVLTLARRLLSAPSADWRKLKPWHAILPLSRQAFLCCTQP